MNIIRLGRSIEPDDIILLKVRSSWSAGVIETLMGDFKRRYPDNSIVLVEDNDVAEATLAAKIEALEMRLAATEKKVDATMDVLANHIIAAVLHMGNLENEFNKAEPETINEQGVADPVTSDFRNGICRLNLPSRVRSALLRAIMSKWDRQYILGNEKTPGGGLYTFEEWIRSIITKRRLQAQLKRCGGVGRGSVELVIKAAMEYCNVTGDNKGLSDEE